MKIIRLLLTLLLGFSLFSGYACANEEIISEMVSMLENSPSWNEMNSHNISLKGPELTNACIRLAKLPEDEVEAVVSAYMKKYPPMSFDVDAWSKIYVFNRFYFRITDEAYGRAIKADFGGVWGREKDELGNKSWPWHASNGRQMELLGILKIYTGNPYKGLEEFKFFKDKFELRSR